MATYTENLNLKKPDLTDPASIGDINNNMDIIDEAISNLLEPYQYDMSVTVGASSQTAFDVPFKSGKTMDDVVGIVQANVGNNNLVVKGWALISGTGVRFYIKNFASTSQSGTLYARVIYK